MFKLIKFDKGHSPDQIDQELDQIWGPIFRGELAVYGENQAPPPKFDVQEDQRAYRISAELPGVDEKNLQVSFNREELCVSGEKPWDSSQVNQIRYNFGSSFGNFHQQVPLPKNADLARATATFQDGFLTIFIPKLN